MRFGPIGDLLETILLFIFNYIPNYGGAVIVFTLFIRMCLLPLDIKSKKSMRRMQIIQPQINVLNKKYANDKAKLNQKTQELFKKEKVSPMAGCLPMLLQMPILFAMFAVMRDLANGETIKMIQEIMENLKPLQQLYDTQSLFQNPHIKNVFAGYINNFDTSYVPHMQSFLWIKNVFQPDAFWSTVFPAANELLAGITASASLEQSVIDSAQAFLAHPAYNHWASLQGNNTVFSTSMLFFTLSIPAQFNGLFILPVMAAVSQFFMTKLTGGAQPAPTDNAANKNNQIMKYFFPLFSVWICASSNAGFALYWVAVNIIQAIQQLVINKWLDHTDSKAPGKEEIINS